MIESIVATDANEIPWTSGSWEPKNGRPSVCSSVAAPETNSAHASSVPICGPSRPAALPTMIGTAITPPNIERMCWSPKLIRRGAGEALVLGAGGGGRVGGGHAAPPQQNAGTVSQAALAAGAPSRSTVASMSP